ncbi:hypothetical protein [Paenibacillus sp. MER 99-2]|uniref:hypothetical protein n=1 Tax=Paenibacillus sp. MER 99-2 TaxID=2939572 RepID=UPI00203CB510|nr:hypothetical protein [Paenibacillus sp. MER 99-2]MCM3172885.1 hypothetical protein [Paenibacillus sp. MER 99-2]
MSEHATTKETITISKGSAEVLHIYIPYNIAHIERIRRITGRAWQAQEKVWVIPYTTSAIQEFMNQFDPVDVQIAPELWVESEDLQQWKASKESSAWSKEPLQKALTLRG